MTPDPYSRERCLAVTKATEKLLRELSPKPSEILDGLAPRPRPGAKFRAQESYREMLHQLHELRRVVEATRPIDIAPSSSGDSVP